MKTKCAGPIFSDKKRLAVGSCPVHFFFNSSTLFAFFFITFTYTTYLFTLLCIVLFSAFFCFPRRSKNKALRPKRYWKYQRYFL